MVKKVEAGGGSSRPRQTTRTRSAGADRTRRESSPPEMDLSQLGGAGSPKFNPDAMKDAQKIVADKTLQSLLEALKQRGVLPDVLEAIKQGENLPPDKQGELAEKILNALKDQNALPRVEDANVAQTLKDLPRILDEQVKAGIITPEQKAKMEENLQKIYQGQEGEAGLKFLYPSPNEILHADLSKNQSSDDFSIPPKLQAEMNATGDKIKNVLGWQIMSQMLVKASQTALDTFLIAEKWQYEQQITIMQFMQTLAQMVMNYTNNVKQGWDQLWEKIREQDWQQHMQRLRGQ